MQELAFSLADGRDEKGVTFRYKDYRRDGVERQRAMTLAADEFIRRFLLHVLPRGFHRIRHYGLLAGSARKASLALARELLNVTPPPDDDTPEGPADVRPPCPCCGGRMVVIERFERWVPASCAACLTSAQPGERAMIRHDQVARTTAPRRRWSRGRYVHVAVEPVITRINPAGINAPGSATWPGSLFHDLPGTSYAEVRDRRWHIPRHKSP